MIIVSANLHRFDIFDKRVYKLKDDNTKLVTSTVGFIAIAGGKTLSFYSGLLNIEPQTFLHDTEIIQILQLSPCSVAVIGEDFEIYEYFSDGKRSRKTFQFQKDDVWLGLFKYRGETVSVRIGKNGAIFDDAIVVPRGNLKSCNLATGLEHFAILNENQLTFGGSNQRGQIPESNIDNVKLFCCTGWGTAWITLDGAFFSHGFDTHWIDSDRIKNTIEKHDIVHLVGGNHFLVMASKTDLFWIGPDEFFEMKLNCEVKNIFSSQYDCFIDGSH